MNIAVQVQPAEGAPSEVTYRWDFDTDILTASVADKPPGDGMSGSVELTGSDAACVILDVQAGLIIGVEVAVWPDVRKVAVLTPPAEPLHARAFVPMRKSQPGIALVEVETTLIAESDQAERTIHFRLGGKRATRTLRIAGDVLLDLDGHDTISGLWLLNVPPFPVDQ